MSESSPAATGETVVDTTTSTTPAETAVSTSSDATTAAPSTATEKPAGTMLDAVKAAIAPKDATPASTSKDPSASDDPDSTKTDTDADDEMSPEEVKALTARTQRRFKKLTDNLKAISTENQSLKPKADEYDKIDSFVRNAGLSQQDVAGTLEIAAMLRSQPANALARLEPIVAQLRSIVGETLPADLQQRVDQGYLTESDAKTLAKAQAGERLATARSTALTEQQQSEQRNREFQTLTTNTVSSVETWEAQQASRDPDWHLKRDSVAELVELAIERKTREVGKPWFPNADEAIKLSADALKTINDRTKRFGPKPQEIRPVLNGGASPRSTAQPKNLLDVVRQTVGA